MVTDNVTIPPKKAKKIPLILLTPPLVIYEWNFLLTLYEISFNAFLNWKINKMTVNVTAKTSAIGSAI